MSDRARAQAWRTAALVLVGGWVVLACGGGDDEEPSRVAPSRLSPAVVAVAGSAPGSAPGEPDAVGADRAPAVAADAAPPCAAGPASAPTRPALQAAIDAELDAVVQAALAQPAGTVEVADPFEDR